MSRVGVVGGGLAGITAALDLAAAGREVELLESRPWLGGLAAADALARPGADPLVATPAASKAGTARHALAVLARGRAA